MAMFTLVAAPLLALGLTAVRPHVLASGILVAGALVIAVLTVCDLVALASTLRAAWRKKHGRPPLHPHVDYGVGEDWTRPVPPGSPYREQPRAEVVARGSPGRAARTLATIVGLRLLILAFPALLAVLSLLATRPQYQCRHVEDRRNGVP